MPTNLLELRHISKVYKLERGNEFQALRDISFSIPAGDIIALVGPSGSGKSTCLKIACGLIQPTEGQVSVMGQPLSGINNAASLVFQSFALFPWHTVQFNIALGLQSLKLSEREVRRRVKRVIDIVGLEGFEEAYPRELSGGMKQRVGIARALVMERPLLLMDEPFSALDVLTAETLRAEVQNILLDEQTQTQSMILVTHNIQEAVFMAKRIILLGINPGHIRAEIRNTLPFPRDDRSEAFQQLVSEVHGKVTEILLPDHAASTTTQKTFAAPQSSSEAVEMLPNIPIIETIGLLEAIADRGGATNLFELSQRTRKEFGTTLLTVKAVELLDLVETPKQMVVLTTLGRQFIISDMNQRKAILHHAFQTLHIVQMIIAMLRVQPDFRLPLDRLLSNIEQWLPSENPTNVVEALVAWGRFAEVFGYNDDTQELYLDLHQDETA